MKDQGASVPDRAGGAAHPSPSVSAKGAHPSRGAKMSPLDQVIYDCYVVGKCGARVLADELNKPMQYIYVRGSVLARRFGHSGHPKTDGPVRARLEMATEEEASPLLVLGGVDWDLVKELRNDGASAREIGAIFHVAENVIEDGPAPARRSRRKRNQGGQQRV